MNFARPYQDRQRAVAAALRTARAAGEPRYQAAHGVAPVDPREMSDAAIDLYALREAQRHTERLINIHNEQQARA